MIVTIAAGILLAFFILRMVGLLPYVILILVVLYLIGSAHANCLPSSMVGSQVNEQCEEEQYEAACESAISVCDKTPGVTACVNAGVCLRNGWQLTTMQKAKPYWYCLSHVASSADTGFDMAWLAEQCKKMKAADMKPDPQRSKCYQLKEGTAAFYDCVAKDNTIPKE